MFISIDEEEISLPFENGIGEEPSKSFHLGSNPNPIDAELPASTLLEAPSLDENHQLENSITILEGEILELRLRQKSIDDKRRETLNKILEIKGCIRVFCRVRPCLLTDRRRIHRPISVESEKIVVRSGGTRKEFGFDKVFQQEATQDDVFVEVAPILRSALDGHNVCILAYGQTGTGKTFTMDGTDDSPGIVPRVLKEIFRQASAFDTTSSVTFSISMLEVYLGHLRDLLAPKMPSRTYSVSRCNLNIQTDPKGTVEIEGLTDVEISNFSKASWWYTKGRRVRSTSWTNVNESSSRSHCLTRITIYRRLVNGDGVPGKTEISKLWMVDLGGSERLLKTGATGQTLDEGRAINLSLSALGDVIAALRRKRGHVPYRNSKLTQILRDSLGDGSKALMLVHVSPYEEDVGETTCSFTFAKRARAVESNRELPEELKKQKQKKILELEEKMKEAEVESQKISNQIQKAEFLLSENRKILSARYHLPEEDEERLHLTPRALTETPKKHGKPSKRGIYNSVPRFMGSTVASRERQTAAEREIDKRARTVRLGTRSLIQMSGSQSNSCSDPRFKALLKNPNKKSRYGEIQIQNSPIDNLKCNEIVSKASCMPRSKVVTSSDPNLRVTISRHRRRMSDLN